MLFEYINNSNLTTYFIVPTSSNIHREENGYTEYSGYILDQNRCIRWIECGWETDNETKKQYNISLIFGKLMTLNEKDNFHIKNIYNIIERLIIKGHIIPKELTNYIIDKYIEIL